MTWKYLGGTKGLWKGYLQRDKKGSLYYLFCTVPFIVKPVHVGFMVDSVTLEQDCLRVPRLSPVSIIPPTLKTHPSSINDAM
jgi:hypothetical protein